MKFGSTKINWSKLFDDSFASAKWLCVKVALAGIFCSLLSKTLFRYSGIPYPVGLYSLFEGNFLHNPVVKTGFLFFVIVLLVLYLSERKMVWVTALLFVSGVLVFSVEESNGIWGRAGLLSLVFFAQFAAYFFHTCDKTSNLNYNRIQFSLQFVAAVYTLSAISKLYNSGIDWVIDSPSIALQAQKDYEYAFVTYGDITYREKGIHAAGWVMQHPLVIKLLVCGALLLEAFSGLMLINRKSAFMTGLLLLCMHIGIFQLLNISFMTISVPMAVFCLNPLFLFYVLANNAVVSVKQSSRKV